jgi:hypothetical protein
MSTQASTLLALLVLAGAIAAGPVAAQELGDSRAVVRATPYAASQGVAENLATIRRWVLFGESFCEQQDRHLLMDRRWSFLGYIDDGDTADVTNERLNEARQDVADSGRVDRWVPGTSNTSGYPFALACDLPFTDIHDAIARVTGENSDYRLWGTWDGMSIGTEAEPVSLAELFQSVVNFRRDQQRFSFPDEVIPVFLGKIIIESGGNKYALSGDRAIGILQLLPEVLDDCEIPDGFRLHRIAQVDCALRLMEQNHRNLNDPFNQVFGHLPESKRSQLYTLLLVQAYQLGVGRTVQLLLDDELGRAARYFAEHQEQFSAEDIQVGMIFHNLGRRDIGMLTLYYVTDTHLATDALRNR